MNPTRSATQLIVLMAGALVLAACGKSEAPPPPPANPAPAPAAPAATPAPAAEPAPASAQAPASATKFESVVLGNAVDAAGKLTGPPATAFKPNDTIYAVVSTNNTGSSPATIVAQWVYQGTTPVSDSSQTVTASGPSVTTFHIEKASGFPPGAYTVAITIDGNQVGIKDFDVK
jgi:hypothetical protein